MATVVGDLLVKLRGDTAQFEKSMKRASAQMTKLGKKMTGVGRSIGMGLSLPLLGVGVAATKMAADFDMTMSRIVGLVGESREDVAAWREEIIKLGPSVAKSSNELGEALFFVTSAGIKGARAMETVRVSAMGASAGLGDTAVVADAVTSAMNAYATSGLSAAQSTAILVATVREGKAEASSLAPVLGRIMPVAANLGISFDQVGAAMAAMTRLGFDAATSATSLRATMMSLTKTTPKQVRAAEKLGLSFTDLRKTIREEGLIKGLMEIKEAVGDNETAMVEVFPNVRALSGVLAMLGENAEGTQKIFARMAKTTEQDLVNAFQAAEEQAGFKFKQAMVSLQNLMIKLGDDILPKIVPLVEKLTLKFQEWSEWWGNLDEKTKGWILRLGAIGIVLGPVIVILGLLAQGIGAILAVAGGISGAVSGIAAAGAAIGGLSAPIGAAIAGAAGLTIGLAALAGGVGWLIGKAIRPYVNEMLGLNKALGLVANKHKDLVGGLSISKDAYQSQYDAYVRLRKQLGLVGKEWAIQADHTDRNAAKLSKLTEKVITLARKESELGRKVKESLEVRYSATNKALMNLDEMTEAVDDATEAEGKMLDGLKTKYAVLDKSDIIAKMKELGADAMAMKDTIDQTQLADKLGEPMLMVAKLAAENKVEVPKIFQDGARAMGKHMVPGLEELISLVHTFKNDFTLTGKEIDGIFFSAGETAEKALGDGFRDGVARGVEEGGIMLQDFVKRIEDIPFTISPQLNLDAWNQAVQDANDGRVPDTTG